MEGDHRSRHGAPDDAIGDGLGTRQLPVLGVDRVANDPHSEFLDSLDNLVIRRVAWRSDAVGGVIAERLLGACDGAVELVGGQIRQHIVVPCVVAECVPLVGRTLHDVGVSGGIGARDEEGRLGSIALQHVEDLWGDVGVGTVVEDEVHLRGRHRRMGGRTVGAVHRHFDVVGQGPAVGCADRRDLPARLPRLYRDRDVIVAERDQIQPPDRRSVRIRLPSVLQPASNHPDRPEPHRIEAGRHLFAETQKQAEVSAAVARPSIRERGGEGDCAGRGIARQAGDGDGVGLGYGDDARPGCGGDCQGVLALLERDLVAAGCRVCVGVAVGKGVERGVGGERDRGGAVGHLEAVGGCGRVETDVEPLDAQRVEPVVVQPQPVAALGGPVGRRDGDAHHPQVRQARLVAGHIGVGVGRRVRHLRPRLGGHSHDGGARRRPPVGHPELGLSRAERKIDPRQRQRRQRRIRPVLHGLSRLRVLVVGDHRPQQRHRHNRAGPRPEQRTHRIPIMRHASLLHGWEIGC